MSIINKNDQKKNRDKSKASPKTLIIMIMFFSVYVLSFNLWTAIRFRENIAGNDVVKLGTAGIVTFAIIVLILTFKFLLERKKEIREGREEEF